MVMEQEGRREREGTGVSKEGLGEKGEWEGEE